MTEKEVFEAWAGRENAKLDPYARYEFKVDGEPVDGWTYDSIRTEMGWRAWQAALESVKRRDAVELARGEPTGETCKDCGGHLLFSCRQIGDGLCHTCAHRRLTVIRDTFGGGGKV